MTKGAQKLPTVFVLYVPGGGMLGMLPAYTLARIEDLLEDTPTHQNFQVIEGVSTGSILAAAFSALGLSAKKLLELYVQLGPVFFPDMPTRWMKMNLRHGLNIGKVAFGIDPQYTDRLALNNISKLCRKLKRKSETADPELKDLVNELESAAKEVWLSRKQQKNILNLIQEINRHDPELEKYTEQVAQLVATRSYFSSLTAPFKRAAACALDRVKDKWAPKDEILYKSEILEGEFKRLLGNRMIDDSLCSLYISSYDIINKGVVTFSSLKKNLFDTTRGSPSIVKNALKCWDAVMASVANEFALKAHITETNLLCADKAPFHKPRCINDVLNSVPQGTRVVLLIAGTGKYLSDDLASHLGEYETEDDENVSEEKRYRKKLEFVRDARAEFGVAGNLMLGYELNELEAYTSSEALDDFREKLGAENIFELSPRLAPYTPQEAATFPSRDILNASEENIKKIIDRGRQFVRDNDGEIRKIAQMIADNHFLLGNYDEEKYARICKRIGLKEYEPGQKIEDNTAKGLEDKIASNDNSRGLRRVFRQLMRKVYSSAEDAPIPRRPRGPGGP